MSDLAEGGAGEEESCAVGKAEGFHCWKEVEKMGLWTVETNAKRCLP